MWLKVRDFQEKIHDEEFIRRAKTLEGRYITMPDAPVKRYKVERLYVCIENRVDKEKCVPMILTDEYGNTNVDYCLTEDEILRLTEETK